MTYRRVSVCACGGVIRRDGEDDLALLVGRHRLTPEHLAWLARGGMGSSDNDRDAVLRDERLPKGFRLTG